MNPDGDRLDASLRRGRPVRGRSAAATVLGVLATALLIGACGESPEPSPDAMPLLPEVSQDAFDIDRVGIVRIIEGAGPNGILAAIYDGPELPGFSHYFSGDCDLYVRDRPCANCSRRAIDVGSIAVHGLQVPLQFDPAAGYSAHPYPAAGTQLFFPGAPIRFDAPGRVGAGFSVELAGVPPIEGTPAQIAYDGSQRVEVRWTGLGVARVALVVPIGDRTRRPEALLRCESVDDGVLVIDRFLTLPQPWTDAPQWPATIMRFNRTAVSAPDGHIEFEVGHEVVVDVQH